MKRIFLAASISLIALPSIAQDVAEPPISPVVVHDIQVEEARNGGGSANMGSSGFLAVTTLVTVAIIAGIVAAVKD